MLFAGLGLLFASGCATVGEFWSDDPEWWQSLGDFGLIAILIGLLSGC